MIRGIGTDIIEVERIGKAAMRPNFLERYFTEAERAFFDIRKGNEQTIAGNFAVKEAVSKALGTGFTEIRLIEIEVLRDPLGKPVVKLHGKALVLASQLKMDKIHVSIAHTSTYATAYVVGESWD